MYFNLKYIPMQHNQNILIFTLIVLICFKVYDPYSNDCIALTDKISITDIDCILNVIEDKNKFKNKKTKFLYQSNIRCYRGKMDEINRSCICDDGWTSSLNMNFTIVTTVPVYACTVQVQSKKICKLLFMINNLESKNFVSFLQYLILIYLYLKK